MIDESERRLRLAARWLQMKRPERALDELRTLRGEAAFTVEAFACLGAALHGVNRHGEAATVLRQGLSIHGPTTALFLPFGAALQSLGRMQEAEDVYLAGLRHDPEDPDLWIEYAESCVRAGQSWKAVGPIERAAELVPADPRVDAARARVAFAQKKYRAMRHHSRAALGGDPEDPANRALYGTAQLMTGDRRAGYRSIAAAAASDPAELGWREAARQARVIQHPLMYPLRPLDNYILKLGLMATWVVGIIVLPPVFGAVALYSLFCYIIYSWLVPPLLRYWLDRRAAR